MLITSILFFCSDVNCVKMSSTVRLECALDVTQDYVKTSSMPPGQIIVPFDSPFLYHKMLVTYCIAEC